MKRVLLTGVSGFIGSHTLSHFLSKTDWEIVGIASWKHKGVPERILDDAIYQANKDRVKIITHDLQAPFSALTKAEIGHIDYIVNVASESHVDRSIVDPAGFIKNNVDLVLNVLEFAREVKPEKFIQISTDEVYGPAQIGQNHEEWSPIKPSNPYAASKAAQEAIAISYWRTFGVPVAITNTMNNFGERQDAEKFIPLVIKSVLRNDKVTIHSYPDGKTAGSRFYLHARNHADAVMHLLNNYNFSTTAVGAHWPTRFNVVGDEEMDNLTLAKYIASVIGKPLNYELVDFHSSRPGHDTRYALDGSNLAATGWKAPVGFEVAMKKTIEWTLANPKWLNL